MWKALIRLVESWAEKPTVCKHKWDELSDTPIKINTKYGGSANCNIKLFCCKECGEFKKVMPGVDEEVIKRLSNTPF